MRSILMVQEHTFPTRELIVDKFEPNIYIYIVRLLS